MIRRIAFSSFFLLSLVPAGAQDVSRITRVTLYPGSATIERTARVSPGATRLELSGLPTGFDPRTIRIEAENGIRLGDFAVREVSRTDSLNPRQAELEAKIEAIEDQVALIEVERQSAELVTGYLQRLSQDDKEGAKETRNLGATLEVIRHGASDAYGRIQKAALQKRALERQRDVLQRELKRIAEGGRDSRSVVLSLATQRGGEVRVSYQVDGPGWQPTYRAHLDSATGKIALERQAVIAQRTGEDWSNVSLRLSTGQPRSAPQGRAPRVWQLGIAEPRREAYAMAPAAPAPAPALSRMEKPKALDEALFDVTEIHGAYATEFEVPAQISLPADGRKVTVALSRAEMPVKLRVQVVPKQDPTAFLVALGERPEGVWLAGEMQLYRDGAYLGSIRWQGQEAERMELPFGRDDLVHVAVTPGKQSNGSGGFIEQRRERRMSNEYVVSNRHKQPIELLVLEPSPVGTHDTIKVESRFLPRPSQRDWEGKTGVVAWQVPLGAGASQMFSAGYEISWPKEAAITGL